MAGVNASPERQQDYAAPANTAARATRARCDGTRHSLAERALKKAILHRKSALFYKTMNGAGVGDLFMTLIHTAELAGANPFHYLVAVLRHTERARRDPADWLPWTYAAAIGNGIGPQADGSAPT